MHLEEPPKIIQPRDHQAKVAIWADLTVSDLDSLEEAITVDQVKDELAKVFGLEDYKETMKNGVLVDLYFYLIQFSRDNHFSKEQTSAFFSIVKQTHEVAVETPFGNVEQTFKFFREMVLCHACKRPPYSIDLFKPEHVKLISEYVINTYFRHFKLYKYVFTPLVRLDLSMTYNGMPETPPPSEHGDEEGEKVGEGEEGAEGEVKDEGADGQAAEKEPEKAGAEDSKSEVAEEKTDEESPAAKELRALIKEHLSAELKQLKVDVDQQIKESEETISKKLSAVEGSPAKGKGSAKGKKK